MSRKKIITIATIGIFLLALILRLWRLPDWYFFNIDEDWFNFIVRRIAFEHRPVLIGWQAPGGFFVPPVMYYYGALVSLFSQGNLLGMAISAAFFSSLTTVLIIFAGKELFNSWKVGLLAGTLFATSYLANIYSRLTITMFMGPLLTVATYICLHQIIVKKNNKYLMPLGLIFPFATQEGSLISLILLSLLMLGVFVRKKLTRTHLVFLFLPLLISIVPLLIFDLRHDFQIVRRVSQIFVKEEPEQAMLLSRNDDNFFSGYRVFLSFMPRVFLANGPNDLNTQILPCEKYQEVLHDSEPVFYPLIGLFITAAFLFLTHKHRKFFPYQLLLTHLAIIVAGLSVFRLLVPGHLHEWFFVLLIPTFTLVVALILTDTMKKSRLLTLLSYGVILAIVALNIQMIITGSAAVSFADKLQIVQKVKENIGNEPFSLEYVGDGCNVYGIRYLFTYLGTEPTRSFMDSLYNHWHYEVDETLEITKRVVLVIPQDLTTLDQKRQYEENKQQVDSIVQTAKIEALIFDTK
ncbi:hypothetical protein C4564_00800 [Candidatus Microgenomates bacterium]|nr:MAG: hypothetical protein C4564_00800 [Candidatus Microgenomates bacterium]